MTQIREKTLKMLEKLPDDKLIYVFNILQNIEAFSQSDKIQDLPSREGAFATLMKYSRSLPEDFEDCLQMKCAMEVGAEYIITRNLPDFVNSEIPVIEGLETVGYNIKERF